MKAQGTQKFKNIVNDLLELERLTEEFRRLKAKQADIIKSMGAPQEALVRVESDLGRIRRNINAMEAYTSPRRQINWN